MASGSIMLQLNL